MVLDYASIRTLYVGALRDSPWPTLSAFLREMSIFAQKNKKKFLTLDSGPRKTDSPNASRTKNWLDMPKFSSGPGVEPSRQAVIRHPQFAFSDPSEQIWHRVRAWRQKTRGANGQAVVVANVVGGGGQGGETMREGAGEERGTRWQELSSWAADVVLVSSCWHQVKSKTFSDQWHVRVYSHAANACHRIASERQNLVYPSRIFPPRDVLSSLSPLG